MPTPDETDPTAFLREMQRVQGGISAAMSAAADRLREEGNDTAAELAEQVAETSQTVRDQGRRAQRP